MTKLINLAKCALTSAALLLMAAIAGCATTMVPKQPDEVSAEALRPESQHHTIYVDKSGYLIYPTTKERVSTADASSVIPATSETAHGNTQKAQAIASRDPEAAYVAKIIDNFFKIRERRFTLELTLHIHGGLNTFEDASERSDRFANHMLADNHYPVFIGWPSDAVSMYWDHIAVTRRGQQRNVFETFLLPPFIFVEDITRAIVRLPVAIGREAREAVTVSIAAIGDDELAADQRIKELKDTGFNVVSPGPYTGVGKTYWSFLTPLKLLTAVSAPAVDGFGSGPWDQMLRRTDLVLSKTSVFEGKPPKDPDTGSDRDTYADTATARFLQQWMAHPGSRNVTVNLIGHSMGSIVALNILSRYPKLKIDNVVFMGAAARVKDVENVLVPWMQMNIHKDAKFYSLSLDPYNEIAERNFWDTVPRGSLLNWIDNFLGEVNSFRDRTAGSWWNIARTARDVFPKQYTPPGEAPIAVRSRVTLKRFPIKSNAGPQRHGDFNSYCFWQTAFWKDASDSLPFMMEVWFPASIQLPSCVGRPLEEERKPRERAVLATAG
jgi:pimeloyl-ACP methyl ester carboxylesterase